MENELLLFTAFIIASLPWYGCIIAEPRAKQKSLFVFEYKPMSNNFRDTRAAQQKSRAQEFLPTRGQWKIRSFLTHQCNFLPCSALTNPGLK